MKRFLKTCLLFLLPVLLVAVGIELALRSVDNPYKQKYAWMQANADSVETLVMGSSHTYYGIRPRFLDGKAYSLANVSQDWQHDLFLLRYWENRLTRLKTLIVPVSAFSWFGGALKDSGEAYRCRFYKIYMDCDLYSDLSLHNLELGNLHAARGKLGTFVYNLIYPPPSVKDCELGWNESNSLSRKDMERWNDGSEAREAVERHTAKTWEHIDENRAHIRAIADLCKRHGVRLVLVTTPCWKDYYAHLPKPQLAKMHALTRQLQREYGITYLDYMTDSRFTADDLYDSNHLSEIGAEKFTRLLNEDIKVKR